MGVTRATLVLLLAALAITATMPLRPSQRPIGAQTASEWRGSPLDGSARFLTALFPAGSSSSAAARPLTSNPVQEAGAEKAGGAVPAAPSADPLAEPVPSPIYGSCNSPCSIVVGWEPEWHRALASSYGINDGYLGGHLACGGRLDNTALVIAHRTLPCGTKVQFRFRGHVVTGVVRDRGPYVRGRIWDFGPAMARALHFNGLSVVEWRFP